MKYALLLRVSLEMVSGRAKLSIACVRCSKVAPRETPLALKAVIEDIVRLLHGEIIKHQILVRTELLPDLPQVVGDRTQLQQVFMNLIMNAIEAMKPVKNRERLLEIKLGDR